jgi:LysM repeat protein
MAPVAVLVAATAVYLVVQTGLRGESSGTPTTTATTAANKTTASKKRPATYVVRSGDTLSLISHRTGISLEHLQEYNPSIDPNSLRTGQTLKLRKPTKS